jgi:membrane complex biogenesis BtpA family protein
VKARGLIGVVHLLPLPGDPAHTGGGFGAVEQRALEDARSLVRGGVDAVLVENFGSAPFQKGTRGHRIPPHQVATLALMCRAIASEHRVPVGVNCLRNDARSAVGIAAAAGAQFVRVNVHVGAYATDQGVVEGEAADTLRYRQALGAADVAIIADVLVKHAAPLVPVDAAAATRDTIERGLADAVVVTGDRTGAPVSRDLLSRVREAAGVHPVLIGSGLTPDNAADLAPLADGAIVGTALKRDGDVRQPVDPDRVRGLAAAVANRFHG